MGKFVKTRWAPIEKGGDERCRFVAQEFTTGDPREELFIETPCLFAARLLLSTTASSAQEELCVMVWDIACSCLYVRVKRTLYIELPGALRACSIARQPAASLEEIGLAISNMCKPSSCGPKTWRGMVPSHLAGFHGC